MTGRRMDDGGSTTCDSPCSWMLPYQKKKREENRNTTQTGNLPGERGPMSAELETSSYRYRYTWRLLCFWFAACSVRPSGGSLSLSHACSLRPLVLIAMTENVHACQCRTQKKKPATGRELSRICRTKLSSRTEYRRREPFAIFVSFSGPADSQ
jgi:hypothetical protein